MEGGVGGVKFHRQKHIKFFSRCLDVLPNAYQTLDTNRMTVLFFAIWGLDILGELESVVDAGRRKEIISWIYSLQVLRPENHLRRLQRASKENGHLSSTEEQQRQSSQQRQHQSCSPSDEDRMNGRSCDGDIFKLDDDVTSMLGFRSSPGNGAQLSAANVIHATTNGVVNDISNLSSTTKNFVGSTEPAGTPVDNRFDSSHLTMTYNALAILLMLKDDLRRVDRHGILRGLKLLQKVDGSFSPMADGGERDMRFVFCAAAIYSILDNGGGDGGEGMNTEKAAAFIFSSFTFEGAFGMNADAEAHGGSSFCALASLILMNKLHSTLDQKQIQDLKRWLCFRQAVGFQGRANKPVDCCYSFWVGASLQLLDAFHLSHAESNVEFTLSCQNAITGGFSKWPDLHPDALHACLGLAGLSLLENGTVKYGKEIFEDAPVEDVSKEDTPRRHLPSLNLRPIHPSLTITASAFEHLLSIKPLWDS